jgi:hypothetical protein
MEIEKILGMNLQVGDKIEIILNEKYKILGYFQGLENTDNEGGMIHYKKDTVKEKIKRFIPDIQDIKILDYKK